MRKYLFFLLLLGPIFCLPGIGVSSDMPKGRVVDALTGKPIGGAVVTSGTEVIVAGGDGTFGLRPCAPRLMARARGYLRAEYGLPCPREIRLMPFKPKALYLTMYGIGVGFLREPALKLIEETELNSLVIDVKGDHGLVPYRSSIPLANAAGAQRVITIKDLGGLVSSLKAKGIYLIARIVVFKDDPLARHKKEFAIKTESGGVWVDREGLSWTDPFVPEVRDYNIDIAEEAALAGFDEVQFDYVRFPDAYGLRYSMPNTEEGRVSAVNAFLDEARERLKAHNVFTSADIFGYALWNRDDTYIGQRLEDIARRVDYISPMLYPSGFHLGIPGHRDPVEDPYEIVLLTLKRGMERTGLPGVHFRPWLQAFRDYAFDRRRFGAWEVRMQIKAAEESGTGGWMLWNPGNVYSADGIRVGGADKKALPP